MGAYREQARQGAGAEAGGSMVFGARERAVRAQRRGKRSAAGDAPGESAADGVAADAEAVGELDSPRGDLPEPGAGQGAGACVDYVVTHELCHLVHGHHGQAFYVLLSRLMPDRVQQKQRLEREGAETGCQAVPCGGGEKW